MKRIAGVWVSGISQQKVIVLRLLLMEDLLAQHLHKKYFVTPLMSFN